MTAPNPYESPAEVSDLSPEELVSLRRQRLRAWLAVPAVAFILLGLLQATLAIVLAVASLPLLLPHERGGIVPILAFVDFIFMIAVVLAGYRMLQLRAHSFAIATAGICCFPLITPFLIVGIPFAIWAFIILIFRRNQELFLKNENTEKMNITSVKSA